VKASEVVKRYQQPACRQAGETGQTGVGMKGEVAKSYLLEQKYSWVMATIRELKGHIGVKPFQLVCSN
jgi:hypothetical protein